LYSGPVANWLTQALRPDFVESVGSEDLRTPLRFQADLARRKEVRLKTSPGSY
jgi:hypothetical protein